MPLFSACPLTTQSNTIQVIQTKKKKKTPTRIFSVLSNTILK